MKITKTLFNNTYKNNLYSFRGTIWSRNYSTSNPSNLDTPTPLLVINNLDDKNYILSKRELLINKGGIYSFTNKINGKQYCTLVRGSAKDLYLRLNEHLSKRKSNSALHFAILKHGLQNFNFCVYSPRRYILLMKINLPALSY